jgi:hypothetical protein
MKTFSYPRIPRILTCDSQLLFMAVLAATSRLPTNLCAQSPEWMLFSPKPAGAPAAGLLRLAISPDGKIWTACNDVKTLTPCGLAVFDGQKWTLYNSKNSGLPDDSASPLVFDDQGNAWIGTMNFWGATGGSGLVKLTGTNWTIYNKRNSELLRTIFGQAPKTRQVISGSPRAAVWSGLMG